MKKAHEVLGVFVHHPDLTDAPLYKKLGKVKDGKLAQELFNQIHSKGFSLEEFTKLEKTLRFKRAFAAIMKTAPSLGLMEMLRTAAVSYHRLGRLDGTIPWELYTKCFECLSDPEFEPPSCNRMNCRTVLSEQIGVFFAILLRHDILSREGGIFADRLITAIELGVPLETIKAYPHLNFPVAMRVLKEFFPQCNEKWLGAQSKEFATMYERTQAKTSNPPTNAEAGPNGRPTTHSNSSSPA